MYSPLRFFAAAALVSTALVIAVSPLRAAPPANLSRQIATAEQMVRERISSDPAHAAELRLVLARMAMVRGDAQAIRHGQSGVLSSDQQARLAGRLAAMGYAGR